MNHEHPALPPLPPSVHITSDGLDMGKFLHNGNLYGYCYRVCTRPKLSYAIQVLARHIHTCHHLGWGGRNEGLCRCIISMETTNRSTARNVSTLHGGAVSWQSKLQATTALSTCEAEYQASGAAVREAIYLNKLLPDLDNTPYNPIAIQGDNQAVVALLRDRRLTTLSRHIKTVSWEIP